MDKNYDEIFLKLSEIQKYFGKVKYSSKIK